MLPESASSGVGDADAENIRVHYMVHPSVDADESSEFPSGV